MLLSVFCVLFFVCLVVLLLLLVGVGVLLLVSGFLGFNAGSLGGIHGRAGRLGHILQNTVIGGAGATATALLLCRMGVVGEAKWAFTTTSNGVLAGLVAVCGAVDRFYPAMAFVTGICGCLMFMFVRHAVLNYKVDDPLDSVAVHFGGGACGVICGALFSPDGILFGINDQALKLLLYNVVGGLAIVMWATACSLLLFGTLWYLGKLRASEESELTGMDLSKHKEPAYPTGAWTSIDFPVEMHKVNSPKKNGSYTLNRSANDCMVIGPRPQETQNVPDTT